jgi:hypothetical protein
VIRNPKHSRQARGFKHVRNRAAAFLTSGLLAAWLIAPAGAQESTPDLSCRVWVDNGMQAAAVSLNGKDLLVFSARGSDEAADAAEDLTARLAEVLADKKFDANQLVPGHDGNLAVIKLEGTTVVQFAPLAVDSHDSAIKSSLKLVNGLRSAFGAPLIPEPYQDLSDKAAFSAPGLDGKLFSGKASWYGGKFNGRKTSDGRRFNTETLTAAHRSLPFGTRLLVRNRKTGHSIVVEVADRGPFVDGRVLDLSRRAAQQLNMVGTGVAMVDCLVLRPATQL